MNGNALSRCYDRLTAQERVRLVLEAMRRQDHNEVDRLAESCPRKTYTMADAACTDLLDGSRLAASVFTIFWLDAHREATRARVAEAAMRLVGLAFEQGFQIGLGAGRRVPRAEDPVWSASGTALRRWEKLHAETAVQHRVAMARLKGLHGGLLRFCARTQLEPTQLLAWSPRVLAEIDKAQDMLSGEVSGDEETARQLYQALCRTWPGLDAESEPISNSGHGAESVVQSLSEGTS